MKWMQVLKESGELIILTHLLFHFCPNETYLKYLKMVAGFVFILSILNKIISIFQC